VAEPTPFDSAFVRARFPGLAAGWALFDNAGGMVPLAGVIERVTDYMGRCQVQLGATYRLSAEAAERVAAGHRAAETLVNADPGEVVLGASSTMNVRVLARALLPTFEPGDEIVVTDLDHEANVGAWRTLEREGLRVRTWPFDRERLELTVEGLEPALGPRTRLVCFTHASNVVGTVHDAAALVRRIHAAGALACIDGVACAPHRRVDVKALDADFYLASLYKMGGPHLGLLYGRRELLLRAAGQNHFFVPEDDLPYKLEPGHVVHELAAALPAVPEHLLALEAHHAGGAGGTEAERLERAFALIAAHETALVEPLLAFLRGRRDVRIVGRPHADPVRRAPTVSFVVDGLRSSAVPPRLESESIAIRFGDFYARRAIEALGLAGQDGVVRVSLAHYNTHEEVGRLIAALDRALPGGAARGARTTHGGSR
jgi:cysteine desulfurase family protein (TIGR01976 family)